MIHVPTSPWAHYAGDIAAWASAALALRWQHRRWPKETERLAGISTPSYFVSLALGALAGAWLAGSANSLRSIVAAPSHSVAGALAGGIVAVELWKWRRGIRVSTGGGFVLPLCVGIAVGRLGCLFAGMADFTYGTPTALPWAVDLGDGHGLRAGQAIRQGLQHLVAQGPVAHAGAAGQAAVVLAGEGEGELVGEELVIGDALAGRRCGIKIAVAFRIVHGADGVVPIRPAVALDQMRVRPFRRIGQMLQRRAHGFHHHLRRQAGGERINRLEAGYLVAAADREDIVRMDHVRRPAVALDPARAGLTNTGRPRWARSSAEMSSRRRTTA